MQHQDSPASPDRVRHQVLANSVRTALSRLSVPSLLAFIVAGALTSCVFDRMADASSEEEEDATTDFGETQENAQMSEWMKMARESDVAPPLDMTGAGAGAGESAGLDTGNFTFDPAAVLPAPEDFSGAGDSGSAWDISGKRAIRTAKGERKLLLTWFTASQTSPRCRQLDREVFQSEEFAQIAEKDLVLLYIDYSNQDTRDSDYYERWKVRHKVRGYPTLVLFSPAGKEVGRIKGYTKGDRAWLLHQLKRYIGTGKKQIESENASLARKGYRHWQNTMGKSFFARYDSREGDDIKLVDLIGKVYRTEISNLSPDDLIWLSKNGKLKSSKKPETRPPAPAALPGSGDVPPPPPAQAPRRFPSR